MMINRLLGSVLVLAAAVLLAQVQSLSIPAPSQIELTAPDARRMLEAQRMTEYRRAEMHKTAEGRAWLDASEAQQHLYQEMAQKYRCVGCDLRWDMKWYPPDGRTFALPDTK